MVSRWLDMHLETFVRPQLGFVPNMKQPRKVKADPSLWTPRHCKAIWGVWVEAKRRAKLCNKPILLAGRDVWFLEVMARIDDYPTVFRPEISSSVATYYGEMRLKKTCPEKFRQFEEFYLIDTGFQGSVPKNLGIKDFHLIRWNSIRQTPKDLVAHQLFPYATRGVQMVRSRYANGSVKEWEIDPATGAVKLSGASTIDQIAGMMENSYKYWTSGTVNTKYDKFSGNPIYSEENKITQTLDEKTFALAAQTTRWIVHNLSIPKEKHRVVVYTLGRGI